MSPSPTKESLLIRSLLFAPANEPRKVAKLPSFGADAIVLDLEDAVAKEQKIAARPQARAALTSIKGPLRCVRVNAFDTGLTPGDVEAVVCSDLDAVILPKVETPQDLRRLDALLATSELQNGMTSGCVRVLALIETCVGVAAAGDIARASGRLAALIFGSGDLGRDLSLMTMSSNITSALAYGRSKLVYDARAAGLPGPIDGPYMAVRDAEGCERDALVARALGHRGKVCIHPDQVAVANRVFGSDPGELETARRVIEAFKAAEAKGAASITVDGMFVDYPIVEKAERILRVADAIAARTAHHHANRRGKSE